MSLLTLVEQYLKHLLRATIVVGGVAFLVVVLTRGRR